MWTESSLDPDTGPAVRRDDMAWHAWHGMSWYGMMTRPGMLAWYGLTTGYDMMKCYAMVTMSCLMTWYDMMAWYCMKAMAWCHGMP